MRAFRQMLSRLKDNFIIFEAWSRDKLLGMVPGTQFTIFVYLFFFFRALLYSRTHFRYRTFVLVKQEHCADQYLTLFNFFLPKR
jgi:hypothetical protein